jgi:hypothetical protein
MEGVPMVLLTLLALAGIFLATVAAIVVLIAAVLIVARRQRGETAPPVEPAD